VQHDVVVIGAGPSGLAAARDLTASGRDVVVLEARDRVGGRTWTVPLNDTEVDLGGQWVGPTQHHLLGLIDEFGLTTSPTPTAGRNVLVLGNQQHTYSGTIPRISVLALAQMQRTLWALDRRAKRIAWSAARTPDEERWDSVSFADWMHDRRIRADVDALMRTAMRVVFGLEAEQIPLLRLLQYVRAAGGVMPLVDTPDGAQDSRIVGGAQQLSQRMADELGDRVRLDAAVKRIDTKSDGVEVVLHDGESLTASDLVVAIPPNRAAAITWLPALPPRRRKWIDGHQMGQTLKTQILYAENFWNAQGRSGEVVWADGPLDVCFDNTTGDGTPCLVVFATGDRGHRLGAMPEAERRDLVLSTLASVLGDAARHPTAYIDCDWSTEVHSGGCPVATLGLATASPGFDPTARDGRIAWAGTETSTVWRGYIDGAIAAGRRAATQVLTA
jgi:monoamine oxidase